MPYDGSFSPHPTLSREGEREKKAVCQKTPLPQAERPAGREREKRTMAELVTLDVGRAAYEPTLRLQERLVRRVKAATREGAYLVLVEHDPAVITLGRSTRGPHVLASADRLRAEGIEVHESSRGGDVTYHGPGQVVGYPVLRLDLHGRDVRRYLRDLEEALIRTLARFGLEGERAEGLTGVWVGGG